MNSTLSSIKKLDNMVDMSAQRIKTMNATRETNKSV